MEPNKIMNADFLDILFEGKNKDYGAYELRKTYNKRIVISVTSMAMVCLSLFLTQILANDSSKDKNLIPVTEVKLDNVTLPEEKEPELPPVQPPKADPVKVEVAQFTPPEIVEDDLATDPPPAMEKLEDVNIGLTDQDGVKAEGFVALPVEAEGTGAFVPAPKKLEDDLTEVFYKVEKEAKFPGGMEAWKKYLERYLNPNVAADDGAPMGNYTVKVQFIVNREGAISNVEAIEVPKACPGCGPEAVKVIKKGPSWEPAVQNGRKVIFQAVQYITFQVAEQ